MKSFSISLLLLTIFCLSFSVSARPFKDKADICKVVAYAGGVFMEKQAQYADIVPTPDVSQECLNFSKRDDVINAVCDFVGSGTIQVIQIRNIDPSSDAGQQHCHYKCLGNAADDCMNRCLKQPIKISTNINQSPCPIGQ